MEKTSLKMMADEYYESIDILQELIEINRGRLQSAINRGRRNEEYSIKRYINMLYEQKRDLIEIAARLKNYYRFSSNS